MPADYVARSPSEVDEPSTPVAPALGPSTSPSGQAFPHLLMALQSRRTGVLPRHLSRRCRSCTASKPATGLNWWQRATNMLVLQAVRRAAQALSQPLQSVDRQWIGRTKVVGPEFVRWLSLRLPGGNVPGFFLIVLKSLLRFEDQNGPDLFHCPNRGRARRYSHSFSIVTPRSATVGDLRTELVSRQGSGQAPLLLPHVPGRATYTLPASLKVLARVWSDSMPAAALAVHQDALWLFSPATPPGRPPNRRRTRLHIPFSHLARPIVLALRSVPWRGPGVTNVSADCIVVLSSGTRRGTTATLARVTVRNTRAPPQWTLFGTGGLPLDTPARVAAMVGGAGHSRYVLAPTSTGHLLVWHVDSPSRPLCAVSLGGKTLASVLQSEVVAPPSPFTCGDSAHWYGVGLVTPGMQCAISAAGVDVKR